VKLIVSIAAAFAFAAAAPAFAAAPTSPNTLKAKNGDVTFNHKTHGSVACTKCHEKAAGGKIEGLTKDKAHGLCVDCHKTQAKGPTKCAECHKKA
jgi:predicted CXXCH cytochrome family protein